MGDQISIRGGGFTYRSACEGQSTIGVLAREITRETGDPFSILHRSKMDSEGAIDEGILKKAKVLGQ